MVFVMCVIADIVNAHVDQPTLAGALENAGFEVRGKHFGEESKDLKLHVVIVA
jgi:hypothetical protein